MSKLSLYTVCVAVMTLCSSALVAAHPTIAGYWALDDSSDSSVVVDEAGLSDGALRSSVTLGIAGVNLISTSAVFGNDGEYIEIPHNDTLLLDSGTVVFWFKANEITARKGLLSKDSSGYDTGGHLTFFLESDGRVSVRLQSTTASYTVATTKVAQVGQWHHVAFVFGTGGMELYLDGVLEASDGYEGGLGTTSQGIGNYEPIVLGANSWKSGDLVATPLIEYFHGAIDELGILSERWNATTIAQLFEQTGQGTVMSLGDFARPPVYFVRRGGSDKNDGLTPQTAFRTVQKGVSSCARAGSTVYVGPGVYQETVSVGINSGDVVVDGTTANPIRVIADTKGLYTLDAPGAVVIDGQSTQEIGIDFSSRVNWVFDGFTFQGQIRYNIRAINAGIDVRNCRFEVPSYYAVFITALGDVNISDCVFDRIDSSRHGVWVTPSNLGLATRVIITRNDLTLKGDRYMSSGLYNGFSSIRRESWYRTFTYGIVVFGWNTSMLSRIEVSNNQVSDCYLGIFVGSFGASQYDSVIANNTVVGSFYSIYSYARNAKSATVINNIIDTCYIGLLSYAFYGNETIVLGLLENGITRDMSIYQRPFELDIIKKQPLFVNPSVGDFSLQLGSPAIDKGTGYNAPMMDLAGRSRPADGDRDGIALIDLGAYELVGARQRVRVVRWHEIGADAQP